MIFCGMDVPKCLLKNFVLRRCQTWKPQGIENKLCVLLKLSLAEAPGQLQGLNLQIVRWRITVLCLKLAYPETR